jgi:thioredoxin reductase (NADPH)
MGEEPQLSNLLLETFLARRSFLMRTGVGLRIIGSSGSRDAMRLREFAIRNRLPHVWVDLDEDRTKADALLERFGASGADAPITIWQDEVLRNPTTPALARAMGLTVELPPEQLRRRRNLMRSSVRAPYRRADGEAGRAAGAGGGGL